jgi:hypothetical protein
MKEQDIYYVGQVTPALPNNDLFLTLNCLDEANHPRLARRRLRQDLEEYKCGHAWEE